MDNLEKKLFNLKKPKLRFSADLKIKLKLYFLIMRKNFAIIKFLIAPKKYFMRNAIAAGLIVALVSVGTSVYAYASNNVTQGNALYPLKKTIEGAEKLLSFTNASKSETYKKFSERRLQEALIISGRDFSDENNKENENIKKTIDDAVNNFNSAATAIKEINNEIENKNAAERIKESESSHIEILNEIEKNFDKEEDNEIVEKINEAKKVIRESTGLWDKEENENSVDEKASAPENATDKKEIYEIKDAQPEKIEENYLQPRDQIKNESEGEDQEKIESREIDVKINVGEEIKNNIEINSDEPEPDKDRVESRESENEGKVSE